MNTCIWLLAAICLGRTAAQSCQFPSCWWGKSYRNYNWNNVNRAFYRNGFEWTFTADGNSSVNSFNYIVRTLDCFAINGSFIIARERETNIFQCYAVRIFDNDTFTLYYSARLPSWNGFCASCTGRIELSTDQSPWGLQYLGFQLTVIGVTVPRPPYPYCESPEGCNNKNMCNDTGMDISNCDGPTSTVPPTTPQPTTMPLTTPQPTTITPTTLQSTTMSPTTMPYQRRKCHRRSHNRGYYWRRHNRGYYNR